MESAGSALKGMAPELVVSKHKLRQAEGSCAVRLKRAEGKQNVGFSSRPFVLCGLPVRKPSKGDMLYERRNGNFVLQVTGIPTMASRSDKTASCRFTWQLLPCDSRVRPFAFELRPRCWRRSGCTKAGRNIDVWWPPSSEF